MLKPEFTARLQDGPAVLIRLAAPWEKNGIGQSIQILEVANTAFRIPRLQRLVKARIAAPK